MSPENGQEYPSSKEQDFVSLCSQERKNGKFMKLLSMVSLAHIEKACCCVTKCGKGYKNELEDTDGFSYG